MDVHKREAQVCIVDRDGTVIREQRILLEAWTESEWVAQSLEELTSPAPAGIEADCPELCRVRHHRSNRPTACAT